jgi:hypothetical protein
MRPSCKQLRHLLDQEAIDWDQKPIRQQFIFISQRKKKIDGICTHARRYYKKKSCRNVTRREKKIIVTKVIYVKRCHGQMELKKKRLAWLIHKQADANSLLIDKLAQVKKKRENGHQSYRDFFFFPSLYTYIYISWHFIRARSKWTEQPVAILQLHVTTSRELVPLG